MPLIFFFITQVVGNLDFSVLLTYSNETPEQLLQQFASFMNQYKITSESRFDDILHIAGQKDLLIIDISSHQIYFPFLDQVSESLDTVYLTITESDDFTFSKYRYSAHLSVKSQVNSLIKLTKFLGWSKFTVFSSFRTSDYLTASYMKTMTINQDVVYKYYEKNLIESIADLLVKRDIKINGVRNLLIIDSGESLTTFLATLEKRKVFKKGFYLILSSKAIYNRKVEGSLIVSEPGTESSVSESHYSFLRVKSILDGISLNSNFKVYLRDFCENRELCRHSLINIQDSNTKNKGFIDNSVNITDLLIFPGNSTSMQPSDQNSKIRFSIANGTSELYHQGYNELYSYFYMGAGFAVARSNFYREIENFNLELFPTDCGNMMYEPNWYRQCFSELLPNMGIAYLTSLWITGIIGNMITLRELNFSIPQISPYGQDVNLENKIEYPEYITLYVSENEFFSTAMYFLTVLNWKSVNVLTSDEEVSRELYIKLKYYFLKFKISIANPLDKQVFPSNYTRDDFDQYKNYFLAAKNTLCRIYIIISTDTQAILEGFYDVGLRKGDFIGIFNIPYLPTINTSDVFQYKIEELMDGSFVQVSKEYVGEYGQQLLKEIRLLTNSTQNLCYSYDSVTIVKNSILHLIAIGEDYEDPFVLNNYIRIQKTIGCMGNLKIDADKNTRSSFNLGLNNIYFAKESHEIMHEEAIQVNKYSQIPIQIKEDFVWSGGKKTIPKNFIEYNSCGFDDRKIKDSEAGKNAFFLLSGIILAISIISAIISVNFYGSGLPIIEEDTIITINDKYFLTFFVCEFFQICSNGNRKGLIYEYGLKAFLALGLNFFTFFQYDRESSWNFLIFLASIEICFCILCVLEVCLPQRVFENLYFFSKVHDVNIIMLPVLGHIGFQPLISMSLNIFLCREGISDALEDSYAEFDCKTFCYKDKHKDFAIISFVSIIWYLITAIILRPYWENKSLDLNIRTKPLYLGVLSVFQVIIALFHTFFKFSNNNLLGYVNSIFIGLFIVFTVFFKPFNYERARVFQLIVLSMCFCDTLLGCIIYNYDEIKWKLLQVCGMGVIFIVGMIYSGKFPKKFISEISFPISNLILFQFSKNSKRFLRTSKNLDLAEINRINFETNKISNFS